MGRVEDGGGPFGDGRTEADVLRAQQYANMGRLARGVAHGFNNLIGVILGYVELAKMNLDASGAPAVRHLDLALATLDRARGLSDIMLTLARDAGAAAGDLGEVNPAVEEVRGLLLETLDRRLELDLRLGTAVPTAPLAPSDLRHLVVSLCQSVVPDMPTGGRITLGTGARQVLPGNAEGLLPGDYAEIVLEHTGEGVPAEAGATWFDPGCPAHRDADQGLGLWAVRRLAARHGGDARVADGPAGPGTCLAVWLPNAHRADAQGPARTEATDVLLVDDEPGVRQVLRTYLEEAGYTTRQAGSGAEALDLLRHVPGGFRAVLLDHELPDVQGLDLVDVIRSRTAAPRVVLVTGMPTVAARGLPRGVRVLLKPFLRKQLLELVRDELGLEPGGAAPGA